MGERKVVVSDSGGVMREYEIRVSGTEGGRCEVISSMVVGVKGRVYSWGRVEEEW